jgi:hypothetical protein
VLFVYDISGNSLTINRQSREDIKDGKTERKRQVEKRKDVDHAATIKALKLFFGLMCAWSWDLIPMKSKRYPTALYDRILRGTGVDSQVCSSVMLIMPIVGS